MTSKKQKTWRDYWRITLYMDKKQDYAAIVAAAKRQRLSTSNWILRHALHQAGRELAKARTDD